MTPRAAELAGELRVVSLPMRVRFRGVTEREVGLIEGPSGWGEFGAFPEYPPPEAARWLAAALESAYAVWPPSVRDSVPVNATVPAVSPDDVPGVLDRFDGCSTVKIKVAERGEGPREDVDRVAAVRAHAGPRVKIRLDANGGYSVDEAAHLLARLAAYDIEYVEQPCTRVEELRDLRIRLARRGIDIPVAADESIRRAEDPLRVAREHAADLLVVKVAPLGGVGRALEIVADCGLPAVVSSALDSSVGIGAGVALAASLPRLDHACGLGTLALMDGDVTADPMRPVAGVLRPRRVVVDPDLLSRYAVTPDRLAWWRQRVLECAAHL
ncbi:MAG: o-succinylbenzoate synthase [Dermatophilaceae bacterium]